ncbi:hypothetical protein M9H77_29474 [Catharanthus roseus]|uniref:Uncharacterized protein n=1 Tax=Catharanthus roseus TaxID=4058 RepID=A0ACB9ZUJ1_CATRO|nr:hypothetical protein M9H77_29474 [Catharanthus roseus]
MMKENENGTKVEPSSKFNNLPNERPTTDGRPRPTVEGRASKSFEVSSLSPQEPPVKDCKRGKGEEIFVLEKLGNKCSSFSRKFRPFSGKRGLIISSIIMMMLNWRVLVLGDQQERDSHKNKLSRDHNQHSKSI